MGEDITKQLSGDDLIRFLIGDLKAGMDRRIDELRAEVISRVDVLEDKVDRRLMETRPIWETVQATLSEIQSAIRRLERQISELGNDILRLRVDQRDLEDRVNKLSPA